MKHTALDSLGLKQKWDRKKGVRLWDEYVGKVINDTRETEDFYKKKLKDKIDHHWKG
jgi:predicted lactoylglutathione lyase